MIYGLFQVRELWWALIGPPRTEIDIKAGTSGLLQHNADISTILLSDTATISLHISLVSFVTDCASSVILAFFGRSIWDENCLEQNKIELENCP